MCHTSGFTWWTAALVPSWCTRGTPRRLMAPALVIYTGWGVPERTAEQRLSNANWLTGAWFSSQGCLLHQSLPLHRWSTRKGSWAQSVLPQRRCPLQGAESYVVRLGGLQESSLANGQERGASPGWALKGTRKGKTNCGDRTRREERAVKHSETTSSQKDTDCQNSSVWRGTFTHLRFCSERALFAKKITTGPTEPVNTIAFL